MISIGFLRHFVETHAFYAYLLIVPGVIIEGEVVVILAGIFSSLGSLNIYVSFLLTLLGGGLKSVIGYSIGYSLQNKFKSRTSLLKRAGRRIHYFLPRFAERPFWSLFAARFLSLGIYWFALIFAGFKKVKSKTFIEAELSSLLTWSVLMLGLGYLFSYTALSFSRDVRKFLLIILLFFIAFFIFEKVIAFIVELFNGEDPSKDEEK